MGYKKVLTNNNATLKQHRCHMKNQRYAAIDQGTTSTRITVFKEDGTHFSPTPMMHKQITPHSGWVEHDPEEILRNIKKGLSQCGYVDAIGLAHQGESVVAWDRDTGKSIYNAIIWQDQRTEDVITQLKQDGKEPFVKSRAGLPLDAYFSASKMGWIVKHVPLAKELLGQNRLCLGTMDSYFLFNLTGEHVTDFNSASRTSLFNIHSLQWDQELCELFAVPLECLPKIQDNIGNFGSVTINGNQIPVTACIVDQFAGIFGHGCQAPGTMKITFGTGAFLQCITGNDVPKENSAGLLPTLCWKFPSEQPVYGLDGGVYNAASAINWAHRIGLFSDFDELANFPDEPAIARGVAFVPALSGLGCPHWDRSAAGIWAGLSLDTERQDLLQSLLEGIAVRSTEVIEAMNQVVAISGRISIDGGLSSNTYFKQFLANLLQRTIDCPSNNEMTSLGVALLARKGLGLETEANWSASSTPTLPQESPELNELYEKYKGIIQKSKNLR